MSAVAYVRITAEERAKGFPSLERQEQAIRDFAKHHNVTVSWVYLDDPIGRLKSNPFREFCSRKGIADLVQGAETEPWSVVLVYSKDRLERGDVGINALAELKARDKRVIAIDSALSTFDQAFLMIASNVKKPRRNKKRYNATLTVQQRLMEGRKERARQGHSQSGVIPYGYKRPPGRDKDGNKWPIVLHEYESDTVKWVFSEYLRVKSINKVGECLNKQGKRTRRGKLWSRAALAWMLKNKAYIGRVTFGDIDVKGKHPAIISPIIFNKANKLIKKNRKGRPQNGHK